MRQKTLPTTDSDAAPQWQQVASQAFERLLSLPAPVDKNQALPLSPAAVEAARRFLPEIMQGDTPAPEAFPTPRGNVSLEWHLRGIDLEIEVGASGPIDFFYEDTQIGEEWEGAFTENRPLLAQKIVDITSRRQ